MDSDSNSGSRKALVTLLVYKKSDVVAKIVEVDMVEKLETRAEAEGCKIFIHSEERWTLAEFGQRWCKI
jgi:hypothetical protein